MEQNKIFPTLYKKTNTGAVQFWDIFVGHCPESVQPLPEIITRFGQDGTVNPQQTSDLISEGKNLGKKNETTPFDQAVAEAQAKWEKQKKKGYVESREQAEAGENELEGIMPMLAHKFSEHAEKIIFPAAVQPKFDGIRCLVRKDYTLWSRSQKPIVSVPHIISTMQAEFSPEAPPFDGELYNHAFRANFEHIVKLVRQQKKPDPRHTDVQYYVYDLAIPGAPFRDRLEVLKNLLLGQGDASPFRVAQTLIVNDYDELMVRFREFREMGFEGAIVRNLDSPYEGKRSYHLQKVKEFDDAEFKIVGIVEGRGKLQGHAGSFTCVNATGATFEVKMSGDLDRLREYFENPALVLGKMLTVQYQGLTTKNSVPRFPVGVRLRESE